MSLLNVQDDKTISGVIFMHESDISYIGPFSDLTGCVGANFPKPSPAIC